MYQICYKTCISHSSKLYPDGTNYHKLLISNTNINPIYTHSPYSASTPK